MIPKPGSDEKRPDCIPTINVREASAQQNRALPGLVKLALEPEWEAKSAAQQLWFQTGELMSRWDRSNI
jgi:RNA-directed DNA polymerase